MADTPTKPPESGSSTPPPARKGFLGRLAVASESLKYREFRLLTMGSIVLGFGQWFQQIGLGWLVLQVTGSPIAMVTVTAVRGFAALGVSPLAGIAIDRFDRSKVVTFSTGLASIQAIILSILVITNNLAHWEIYAFAIAEGVANGFYMPARQALVSNVVPRESLPNAVVLNSMTQNMARVTGPVMAGAVVGLLGTGWAFACLALCKILAALWTWQIRSVAKTQKRASHKEPFLASLTGGVKYAVQNPAIGAIIFLGIIHSWVILPYLQMLPFFAENVLHSGAQGYGILATGVGWGSLVGLGAIAFVGSVKRKGMMTIVTLLGYALFVGLFSRSTWFPLSMVFLMGAGVVLSIHLAMRQTLLQLLTPDELRGRVFALTEIQSGLQSLGAFPMAVAVEVIGPADAVSAFCIAGAALTVLVAVLSPKLRATTV